MKKGELRELYQMMFPEYPDIVTVKELREMLGISRKLAYKLIDYGYIHAVKIGTTLKIPKISVISGNAATLLVSGRDVEYQELTLQFNDLVWELVERKNSEDIHKAELPKFLFRVVDFMECRIEWVGTATELLTEMKEQEVTANMVTKYLGQFAYEVLEPLGIEYRTKRTGKSRLIKFLRRDGDDANDAGIAI